MSLLKTAHELVRKELSPGDSVIDATVGNGLDTLFLAQQVYPDGKVFGFDIQQAAIDATTIRLQKTPYMNCLSLILANHANLESVIHLEYHGKIKACMFNLGFLPKGDKTIITETESTLRALNSAIKLLSPHGIISIMAYPGHEGGNLETDAVESWCKELNNSCFSLTTVLSDTPKPTAPRLWVVRNVNINELKQGE